MRNYLAADIRFVPDSGLANEVADLDITTFIPTLINLLFVIAAVIFFFMLVLGGIKWIMAGGDKGAVEGARVQITNALIGLAIVLATYAIISLVELFFGVNILGGLDLNIGDPPDDSSEEL